MAAVTMEWVQVNDQEGNSLGNVRVGDTKQEALERLSVGAGGLFDNDNGLLNSELITADGAPYVFKQQQQQQQQQQDGKLRCCFRGIHCAGRTSIRV